jgi:putative transposase
MHLTLKKEATKPPAKNFLQQQAKFDRFIECYNQERPHQALNVKYPAELYRASPRPYRGLPEIGYPFHDRAVTVTSRRRICLGGRKINVSHSFAGQAVGIKEVAEKIWLMTFMHYDLGFFDHQTGRVECAPNPYEAQVLPMLEQSRGLPAFDRLSGLQQSDPEHPALGRARYARWSEDYLCRE